MIGYFPTYTLGEPDGRAAVGARCADLPDIDEHRRVATSRRCASGCATTSTATARKYDLARAAPTRHGRGKLRVEPWLDYLEASC